MLPQRAAPILFALILSTVMTFCVTAIATFRAISFGEGFLGTWLASWIISWAVAFPLVMIFGPIARKLVAKLVSQNQN